MADSKITALASIGTGTDPANDPLVIVDVSDVSPGGMSATGTTKKVTLNNLLACSPTATLASATITGDLTVDTSTLKVDSANNRVGIGTASPISQFANTNTTDTITGSVTDGFAWRSLSNDWAAAIISRPASGNAYALRAHTGGATASDYPLSLSAGASTGNTVLSVTGNGIFTFGDGAGGTRMTLNANGLGVGVTPSAWNSAYRAIEIAKTGNAIFSNNASNNNILFTQNAYYDGSWKYGYTALAAHYEIQNGAHKWNTAASGTAGNAITWTQAMTLTAGGKLLVGWTTGPSASASLFADGVQSTNTSGGGGYANLAISGGGMGLYTHTGTAGSETYTERVRVKGTGQLRFIPLAADPAGAEAGDVYYNSTSNKLKCYNGTTWNDLF